jgi:hypothetical protein
MSDGDLDAKVRDLWDGVLPSSQAARLINVCRNIEHQADARIVAEIARV